MFLKMYEEHKYLKHHRLTTAFRIFAKFVPAEGVAGYITLRELVDPKSFRVDPFGTRYSFTRGEGLVECNMMERSLRK
jgi:hypothetical protein